MPLKLVLKNDEKIIINGAVLKNVGGTLRALVLNEAAILREKDIITEDEALTPASRAYFAIQNLYIFPSLRDKYASLAEKFLAEYAAAAPSAAALVDDVLEAIRVGKYYDALRKSREIVEHEGRIVEDAGKEFTSILHEPTPSGESAED